MGLQDAPYLACHGWSRIDHAHPRSGDLFD
jgi:hypothetical protein